MLYPRTNIVQLNRLLAEVDTVTGRERVARHLSTGPFPQYVSVPGNPGVLCRVTKDGHQTMGRFVGRDFRAIE